MFHLHAKHIFRNGNQAAARDGRQDGVRFRCDKGTVFCDKKEVSTARFLDISASSRIKVHVFVKAFSMGGHISMKTHGVVQASFDMACPTRGCTVKVGNTNGDWLDSIFEIVAYRGAKQTELIFIGWLDPDDGTGCKKVGPQVKAPPDSKGGIQSLLARTTSSTASMNMASGTGGISIRFA